MVGSPVRLKIRVLICCSSKCGRLSSSTLLHTLPLKLYARVPSSYTPFDPTTGQVGVYARGQKTSSSAIGPVQLCENSISLFRRIQVYERPPPLTSAEEAYEKLQDDASDFQANLYLGWQALSEGRIDEATHRLRRAIATGSSIDSLYKYIGTDV